MKRNTFVGALLFILCTKREKNPKPEHDQAPISVSEYAYA